MVTIRRVAIALALLPPLALAEEFHVGHDPKFVNITFESQADVETIVGKTSQATGAVQVQFDGASVTSASVSISVPVESLRTGIELRDEHLRQKEWLDAARFKEISFVSRSVKPLEGGKKFEVVGDFSLHGVTKELKVVVEMKVIPEASSKKAGFPAGKWLKFATDFPVKLSDYGVAIPNGVVAKVSDTWTVKMVLIAGTAALGKK